MQCEAVSGLLPIPCSRILTKNEKRSPAPVFLFPYQHRQRLLQRPHALIRDQCHACLHQGLGGQGAGLDPLGGGNHLKMKGGDGLIMGLKCCF